MEGRKSANLPVDIELYGRITGRLARLLEMLGVKRVARPVDDPMHALAESLATYAQGPADDDDDGDGSDNERQPIEDAVEPTNGGSKPE